MEFEIKSVMLGHAIGDALGVPVEFALRKELVEHPVTDMEGFGTYPYPAGCWSDDTSMSAATLDSLANGSLSWNEIMQNFGRWYYEDRYTPTGEMFDVGNTCSTAIENYFKYNKPLCLCGLTSEHSNGNGSLMRIHPFSLYLYYKKELNLEIVHKASALTHAHERSQIACGIYSFVLWEILKFPEKVSIQSGLNRARRFYRGKSNDHYFSRLYWQIGQLSRSKVFPEVKRDEINSSGYVVDTLEAAIWCLLNTHSYKECVLTAVNLGDDTDTVAAVAGGLAGALYGYDAIPKEWLNKLLKRRYLESLCQKASAAWNLNEQK